jgi:DNA-binding response OmpR family regulator
MANVVVVEDDVRIRQALSRSLVAKGHEVRQFAEGFLALDSIIAEPPDVVLLDLGLPDIDGPDLLVELRKVSDVPVIVATARDDDESVVSVLHAGADDYVIKPFSIEQIHARIVALLRRTSSPGGTPVIVVGKLTIDPRRHGVELGDRKLELTRKEFELLTYLASRPGVMVSKQELLAEVWRQPWGGSEKTVDVHLSWLRKHLGETASEPCYIRAVRGVGVALVDPDEGSQSDPGPAEPVPEPVPDLTHDTP